MNLFGCWINFWIDSTAYFQSMEFMGFQLFFYLIHLCVCDTMAPGLLIHLLLSIVTSLVWHFIFGVTCHGIFWTIKMICWFFLWELLLIYKQILTLFFLNWVYQQMIKHALVCFKHGFSLSYVVGYALFSSIILILFRSKRLFTHACDWEWGQINIFDCPFSSKYLLAIILFYL